MYSKMMVAVSGVLCGAAGFAAGFLVRQPEINRLQEQISCLQADVDQLTQAAEAQNDEIEQLLVNYRAQSVLSFKRRKEIRDSIQDELVCQYASNDYLTLLMDVVTSGRKMTAEEISFYKQYGKMLEDNAIDQRELEVLRPMMMEKHGSKIQRMKECDLQPVFERIRLYNETKDEERIASGFFNLKKSG